MLSEIERSKVLSVLEEVISMHKIECDNVRNNIKDVKIVDKFVNERYKEVLSLSVIMEKLQVKKYPYTCKVCLKDCNEDNARVDGMNNTICYKCFDELEQ